MSETMEMSEEIKNAWEFVEHTGVSIFLTGKAGTGKTTFLRYVVKNSKKTMIVVAPTGVAAINAGGVTIHSFFQLPLSPYVPGMSFKSKFNFSKDKLRIIRALDLLVIDEISMVRSDLLDAVDNALRKYRRSHLPFGGVQLLMMGDLQQLTPVVTPEEENLLRAHYDTPYFFGSHALAQIDYVTINLSKVYRQQDRRFVSLLNHIRENTLTDSDMRLLNSRYVKGFKPRSDEGYIRLTTHNALADNYNAKMLASLQAPEYQFDAVVEKNFPENVYPTSKTLVLKRGTQVMFIKNDSVNHRYFNGKIGTVENIADDHVYVRCPDDNSLVEVEMGEWENVSYKVNDSTNEIERKVDGVFRQLPLRLAWAITIHKSQGLTFDHAVIDAGAAFAPGQAYVALSRCRTLEGLVLATPLRRDSFIIDNRVSEYIRHQEYEMVRSLSRIDTIKETYFRRMLVELFTFHDIGANLDRLIRHMEENMGNAFAITARRHREAEERMRTNITAVANNWCRMIEQAPYPSLFGENFIQRYFKSLAYFKKELEDTFKALFVEDTKLRSGNKAHQTRFVETLTALTQSYAEKLLIISRMAVSEENFNIANYLEVKQDASLKATNDKVKKKTVAKKSVATRAKRGGTSYTDDLPY
jgi:hypothetical protein